MEIPRLALHILLQPGFQPNQKTDTKGFIFELIEGFRTDEMSGSNLHKLSKSSYQKCFLIFSYSLLILYHKTVKKSSVYKRFTVDYLTSILY